MHRQTLIDVAHQGDDLQHASARKIHHLGYHPRIALHEGLHAPFRDLRQNVMQRVQAAHPVEDAFQFAMIGVNHRLPPSATGVAMIVPLV